MAVLVRRLPCITLSILISHPVICSIQPHTMHRPKTLLDSFTWKTVLQNGYRTLVVSAKRFHALAALRFTFNPFGPTSLDNYAIVAMPPP